MTIFQETKLLPSTRWIPALMLGLVLVVLAGCGGDDSNAAKEDVVFSALSDGNTDVFKVDNKTGDVVRLTTATGHDTAPAWSPNKDRIAFLSDRNGSSALWLMDWNGELKRQVSTPGQVIGNFNWAPDSKRIGVEILEANSRWIGVIEIESGELEPLTSQTEDVRIGGWSPDSEWLLYAVVDGEAAGIRRRNPVGVDEITITTGEDTNPVWSPNGHWIAFNREAESGAFDLLVIDKDGEKATNLAPDDFDEISFDWAPDSKHVVFTSESTGNAEIYAVEPSGKNTKQLTSNRVTDAAPRWNSNGTSILFLSEGDGSYDIYSMDKSGEQQKRMTSISDVILEADW